MARPRTYPPDIRRAMILDAARKALVRHGYNNLRIDDVAGTASMAKGTLYLYFRDKMDLLAGVYEDLLDRLEERIKAVPEKKTALEDLREMVHATLAFADEHQDFLLPFKGAHPDMIRTEAGMRLKKRHDEHLKLFASKIRECVKEASLRPHDAMLGSLYFESLALLFISNKAAQRSSKPLASRTQEFMDLFVHGLGRKNLKEHPSGRPGRAAWQARRPPGMAAGLLAALFLLFPTAALPAEEIALSVPQAIERAIEHSETVRISRENVKKLGNTYSKVRAQALPQVSGTIEWDRYIKTPVITVDFGSGIQTIPVKQDWEIQTGATLTQVVWSFGKISTAIDIAGKALDVEESSSKARSNELTYAVKQAYYTILYASETLKITDESHINALENQKALKSRLGGGRVSRAANVKMAADVQSRVPTKLQALNRLDCLLIRFKNFIGADDDARIILTDRLTEKFPSYSHAALYSRMTEREPELKMLRDAVHLNEHIIRLRKTDYFPTVSAIVNYTYSGNSNDMFPRDAMEPMFLAGLILNIPLWDSGTRRWTLREAKNDRTTARLRYRRKLEYLDVALKTALARYRSSIKVYRANLKTLELAGDSYQIALSSFKSGVASQSQLNDAELLLTAAGLRTTQSLYDINMYIAGIEKLTAGENS